MDNETRIKLLEEELKKVYAELAETKEHLKKYTAPTRSKTYYENHKDEIIQRVKEHKKKTNYVPSVTSEKRKEYNKTAYLKKKEKNDNTLFTQKST